MQPTPIYLQYGFKISPASGWQTFNISPIRKLQKLRFLSKSLKSKLRVIFPPEVKPGDIVKGLPVLDESYAGIYAVNALEFLALADLRIALANTRRLLQEGGTFRCVVPDLEGPARQYIKSLDQKEPGAAHTFLTTTRLGHKTRPRGIGNLLKSLFTPNTHLWMWDTPSLTQELADAGFKDIRVAKLNDAKDRMFNSVEDPADFSGAVCLEGRR